MSAALRTPAIRRFVALYAATAGLEWVINIALMVLVFELTGSAAVAAAMLVAANVLPAALVAFASNVFDRVRIGTLVAGALILQGVAIACTGLIAHSAAALILLATVVGGAGAVVRSGVRGGVALASGDDEQYRASAAVINIVRSVTTFAGPAIAGVAVALAGASATLVGAGIVALAAGLAMVASRSADWMRTAEPESEPELEAPRQGAGSPNGALVRLLLGLGAVVSCAYYMDEAVLLPFSTEDLSAGVGGYSAIFAAWGGGVMIGSAIFARILDRPMLRVCGYATVGTAFAYIALGVAPSLPVALAVCVVGGIANGLDWPALAAAVQEAAPRHRQASVAARLESMLTAGPAVGILVGGVAADAVSNRFAIALAGLTIVAAVAVGAVLHRRYVRRAATSATFSVPTPVAAGAAS